MVKNTIAMTVSHKSQCDKGKGHENVYHDISNVIENWSDE